MRLFGLKTCDTCRKALKELAQSGENPQVIDVRGDGIRHEDLTQMVAEFGEKLVNRASTTWRGLSEDERAQDIETLISAHPTLMKRPVIERDGTWTIGWKDDAKAVWL